MGGAADGVLARYSFSVRTATVALGQAGGRDLEAGEGGDVPLVSARISALQGVWESYAAPEGLLWRCDLGAAAVQARAAARAPRPDPTAPPRGSAAARRVQLVRGKGRDVSTLYGGEGGGGNSAAAVCAARVRPPGPLTSFTNLF